MQTKYFLVTGSFRKKRASCFEGFIKYGLYPQKYVSDASIVTGLNNLSTTDSDDWVLYNGEYYAKKVAQPKPTYPNNSNYKFDDGVAIVEGNTYWFKCEPILWNILSNNNGDFLC